MYVEVLLAILAVSLVVAIYLKPKKQSSSKLVEPSEKRKPKKQKEISSVFNARNQLFEALKKKSLHQDADARLPVPNRPIKKWPVLDLGVHPQMDVQDWPIEVSNGQETTSYQLQDLIEKLGSAEMTSDLHCVTTWSVLDMNWKGIPFKRFLEFINPDPEWKYLLQYGADGYSVNVTRQDVEENLERMIIAYEYNGEPISREHGYVRLVIPGLFGWKGSKFLVGLVFSKLDSPGIWEQRGSHERGRIQYNERWQEIPDVEASQEEIESRFEQYDGDTLNLKGLGLTRIPDRVFEEYASVSSLLLDFNRLSNLEEYPWHKLTRVQKLGLNGNLLTQLPASFGELTSLSELFVIKNKLKSLPKELAKCRDLMALWLDENAIEDLPVELSTCEGILVISALNNQITKLHPEYSKLKRIRCFLVRGNPVTQVPPEYCLLKELNYFGIDSIDGIDQDVLDQGTPAVMEKLRAVYNK
jgi:DMSO/TMAO reductase YedYZ molybdopterin-dependent catalytic subunit